MNTPLPIMVVSDVMCPWCFIGKRHLEEALDGLADTAVEIAWKPYQLDPTIPPDGVDRQAYLDAKFGGPERARAAYGRVAEAGRAAGIAFDFDAIRRSPNTLDAHRVIRWSGGQSAEAQERVVEALFSLYFVEGADLTDRAVLASAAQAGGLDETIVRELLETDRDRDAVAAEVERARRLGITGVPCFIFDNRFALMGAQPADQLRAAIEQALASRNAPETFA